MTKHSEFWCQEVIQKAVNFANNTFSYNKRVRTSRVDEKRQSRVSHESDRPYSFVQSEKDSREAVIAKYEQIRANLQQEIDKEYEVGRTTTPGGLISHKEYLDMKQQINYDIAWQIFDEVNNKNDVDRLIDLSCLDVMDAKAITKQKIYDVALMAKEGSRQALAAATVYEDGRKILNYILII